MNDDLG